MRTTVRIDDELMKDLRQRADAERVSLTRLIGRLLRQSLRQANRPRPTRRFRQKTFSMGEPQADLRKALILAANLEDEEILRKLTVRK